MCSNKKILRAVLKKILNESIFLHFSAQMAPDLEFQRFSEKSGSITFELLGSRNFMQSFKEILRAISEKRVSRTHAQTHRRTNGHEFIGPHRPKRAGVQKCVHLLALIVL